MVSAQIDGVLKFYRITPTGSKVFLYGNDIKALGIPERLTRYE